jgi:putative protein-disulfide isomerase
MNQKAVLHYVYDPFCGWCYGLAPLVSAAESVEGVKVVPHSGGMLAGDRAQNMSKAWRDFVRPHEARIIALSGQSFGTAYQEGTQYNYDVRLDSAPPTAAMLAAEQLAGAGTRLLKRLQTAYYLEGRPISERDEIVRLAGELGLDANGFNAAYAQAVSEVDAHFAESQAFLEALDGRGYPTLALEQNGEIRRIRLGRYFGKPELFREALAGMLRGAAAAAA